MPKRDRTPESPPITISDTSSDTEPDDESGTGSKCGIALTMLDTVISPAPEECKKEIRKTFGLPLEAKIYGFCGNASLNSALLYKEPTDTLTMLATAARTVASVKNIADNGYMDGFCRNESRGHNTAICTDCIGNAVIPTYDSNDRDMVLAIICAVDLNGCKYKDDTFSKKMLVPYPGESCWHYYHGPNNYYYVYSPLIIMPCFLVVMERQAALSIKPAMPGSSPAFVGGLDPGRNTIGSRAWSHSVLCNPGVMTHLDNLRAKRFVSIADSAIEPDLVAFKNSFKSDKSDNGEECCVCACPNVLYECKKNCKGKCCEGCFKTMIVSRVTMSGNRAIGYKCPVCNEVYGDVVGECPDGAFSVEDCMRYKMISMKFEPRMESAHTPGYGAREQVAYIEPMLLELFMYMWDHRLLFKVGTSLTNGTFGVVFNSIPIKSGIGVGEHSLPSDKTDEGYVKRFVTQCAASAGKNNVIRVFPGAADILK